jgi:hypothetical protein
MLMENLWRRIILALTEEWSQVLLAHELQRKGNKVASDGLQSPRRVSSYQYHVPIFLEDLCFLKGNT